MTALDELAVAVTGKALNYLKETGEDIENYPVSIVDFVIEYAIRESHVPKHYSDKDKARLFSNYVCVLAMMCNEIYMKVGAEGEMSHNEGNTSRHYESAWISKSLVYSLPNFVNTPSTIEV